MDNYIIEAVQDLVRTFDKADNDSGIFIIGFVDNAFIASGNKNSHMALGAFLARAAQKGTKEYEVSMNALEYYLSHNMSFDDGKLREIDFGEDIVDDMMREMKNIINKKDGNNKESSH